MSTWNGSTIVDGGTQPSTWTEFCETEAQKAAASFARSYHQYCADSLQSNVDDNIDIHQDGTRFAQRFVEHFLEHFETEVRRGFNAGSASELQADGSQDDSSLPRRNLQTSSSMGRLPELNGENNGNVSPLSPRRGSLPNGDSTQSHSASTASLDNHASRNKQHSLQRSREGLVSRKLSFRNFGSNLRNRFRRQPTEKEKAKYLPQDIVREGIVNFLAGEDTQGRQKWERSRLVLVKRNEGYMLDFYSPPKVGSLDYFI